MNEEAATYIRTVAGSYWLIAFAHAYSEMSRTFKIPSNLLNSWRR